jgi:D-glycero-alpha-D-manno-heptose-7-phosphate kinase
MIISRAPLRITLGGGGTDLPSFYERYGGLTISGCINKYVYIAGSKPFYKEINLKYSEYEKVNALADIMHPLFREALSLVGVENNIELTSFADIPSGSGLGSSGSFLVALLNLLYKHIGCYDISKRQLAVEACKIEIDILKLHEGHQDKYASAFGGIKYFEYTPEGRVRVYSFPNADLLRKELEDKLLLFYIGEMRKKRADEVLARQDDACKKGDAEMLSWLKEIKDIGVKTKQIFHNGNLDLFGDLLDKHWEIKKQYSPASTNIFIDNCYKVAKENGALGGKIMGAGKGGFLLFYHPNFGTEKWKCIDELKKLGLRRVEFEFDTEGVCFI